MAIEYGVIAAIVGAIYLVIVQFYPDFPIPSDMFLLIALGLLALVGVEVVGKPAARKIRGLIASVRQKFARK